MVLALVLLVVGAWLLGRLRRWGLGGWLACGAAFMILFGGGQPERSDLIAALIAGTLILVVVRGLRSSRGSRARTAGL